MCKTDVRTMQKTFTIIFDALSKRGDREKEYKSFDEIDCAHRII